MKLRSALFCLLSFCAVSAYAQPALAWAQRYNGPPDYGDEARAIVVDNAGNSYVTGSAFSANGTLDIVTIKYSISGQQLWLQSYNGTANDNDEGFDIAIDDSANVYVVGYSKSTSGMQDITTIKYSSSGIQLWAQTYNGSFNNYDVGNAITVDANGNSYVVGYVTTSNYTYDFCTIKYSTGGSQLWAQTYDGPGNFNDEGRDIALDGGGNVYVTGPSDTFYNSQPNADMVLLKYNNSGTLQWRRVYDSPGHGYEYSKRLAIDSQNNIIVVGYGFITGNGNDYYIMKYNSSGNFQWFRNYNYGTNTFEEPHGMVIDSQNNIIVTGQGITSTQAGTNDYVTVKYDPSGTFQWAARYDNITNLEDRAYAVCMGDSNTIFVTGFSKGSISLYDIATVKYNSAGQLQYVLRYNHTADKDDIGNAVAFRNGDIWVTGKSDNPSNSDYITLRYSYSAVGMTENNSAIPIELYPNPSDGAVRVVVPHDGNSENYTVTILNTLGQTVFAGTVSPSESTGAKDVLIIRTEGLAEGVYTIHLTNGDKNCGSSRVIIR